MASGRTPAARIGAHTQVHVWTEENLAHCELERAWRKRHDDEQPPPVLWCGGEVVDWEMLRGRSAVNRGAVNLGAWQWAFGVTDRERPAVSCASADVHHLYMQQLSWLWTPIRTFDPRRGTGDEAHTSWVDLLDVGREDGVYEVDRSASCVRVCTRMGGSLSLCGGGVIPPSTTRGCRARSWPERPPRFCVAADIQGLPERCRDGCWRVINRGFILLINNNNSNNELPAYTGPRY